VGSGGRPSSRQSSDTLVNLNGQRFAARHVYAMHAGIEMGVELLCYGDDAPLKQALALLQKPLA